VASLIICLFFLALPIIIPALFIWWLSSHGLRSTPYLYDDDEGDDDLGIQADEDYWRHFGEYNYDEM